MYTKFHADMTTSKCWSVGERREDQLLKEEKTRCKKCDENSLIFKSLD